MKTEVMEQETRVQLFHKEEFGTIRTVIIDGEPWFSGKDVAVSLGYENTKDAIKKHVFEEDKSIFQRSQFATLEIPNRGMTFINESGMYSLIFGSKLETARKFKHWVTSEVLPSIRKTGQYIATTDNKIETMLENMGCNMKIVYAQINNMEEMIEEQNNILTRVMDNMTLTTTQQGRLQRAVKDRINHLLGGAHSKEYKENSKLYFINLWGGLKERFNCGSRWQDLNPKYYNEAFDYVSEWEYVEA